MREKINNDPKMQVAIVALLLLAAAFFFVTKMGGGGEEEAAPVEAAVSEVAESPPVEASAAPAVVPSTLEAPPPPAPVTAAYKAGETVVLLVVRDSGVDDKLVKRSSSALSSMPEVALFVVPVSQISHYAAITLGAEVSRVPALVVMTPKGLSDGVPQATVSYGFQTHQTIVQAVRDASYEGPAATYQPN